MTSNGEASGLVLVDSSSWIETLRKGGDPEVRSRVQELVESGRAAWCEVIRLELERGIRGREEEKVVNQLDLVVENLTMDASVLSYSLALAAVARKNGQRPPVADVMIAATARRYDVRIEHRDHHLASLETL